jgi:hypothetical protein
MRIAEFEIPRDNYRQARLQGSLEGVLSKVRDKLLKLHVSSGRGQQVPRQTIRYPVQSGLGRILRFL